MLKRFLQVCKNPVCQKEFGILYDTSEAGGIMMKRCPHCRRLHKVKVPGRRR